MIQAIPFTECRLILTEDCNLRCKYCYESNNRQSKYMSFDTAKKAVDFLIDNILKCGINRLKLTFFGGEPLLNIDVMIKTFHYIIEKARKNNIQLKLSLSTNGTIYNKQFEEFILEWHKAAESVNIQISIDGIPEIQDENRRTINDKPTSEIVMKNILKIKTLFEQNQIDSSLYHTLSVITKNNISKLFLNYKYFKQLGINTIHFVLQYDEDWSKDDISVYIKQLSYIADLIYEECIETGSLVPYNKSYLINDLNPVGSIKDTCQAGKNFCAIGPNGDIYPCHRIYFRNQKFKLGNVFDGIIDNIKRKLFFDAYRADMYVGNISCGKCDNIQCKICMLFNYEQYNDVLKCSPASCAIYKARWDFIIETKKKFYKLFGKYNNNKCSEIMFFKAVH